MKPLLGSLPVAAGLALLSVTPAFPATFERIISAGNPIPGGAGTVDLISFPVFSDGVTAYSASGTNPDSERQIYGGTASNSQAKLVGLDTSIPAGTGTFTLLSDSTFYGGQLAFGGNGTGGQSGVYAGAPLSSYTRVADRTVAMPGGGGETFDTFDYATFGMNAAGDVAFIGSGTASTGIYRSSGGSLSAVVTTADNLPGTSLPITVLEGPALTSTKTFFYAAAPDGPDFQRGIYARPFTGGSFETIAADGGVSPGGDPWTLFGDPVAGGEAVAFLGATNNDRGIYRYMNGTLETLIKTGQNIPGTSIPLFFIDTQIAVNEAGDVLMLFSDEEANRYIYAYVNGQFVLVANTDTVFDGQTPLAGLPSLGFGAFSFSGDQAGIYVLTGSGQFSDYVATIPEPGTVALLAFGGLGVVLWRRKFL